MSWSVSEQVQDGASVAKIEAPTSLGPRQKKQFEQARKMAAQIIRAGHLGGYGKRKVYAVGLSGHANDDTRLGGGTITVSVSQVLLPAPVKESAAQASAPTAG